MIKNPEAWRAWQDAQKRGQPVDYAHNLRVFEELYEHARNMGRLRTDPWEGLDEKIELIRRLHGRPKPEKNRPSP